MRRMIRVLPEQLVNQIAAGEVVERPAAVVKELVENSLDAGARRIEVEVEQGGLSRICVRDDGAGIAREELALALQRHATSKIGCLEDLERVASLGFRGEALPSILSVSRLALTSRRAGAAHGWRVSGAGGLGQAEPEPAAHPVGTTVEVADLFFNTPARRKFMRADATEFRHVQQAMTRVALARFDAGFSLVHGARRALDLPPAADDAARGASAPSPTPSSSPTRWCSTSRDWGFASTAGSDCRRGRAAARTSSTSTSTAGRCATGWSAMRCGGPTPTCCTEPATRPTCCTWRSTRRAWT
jgi:DNA mismatch repair protein MutL